MISTSSSSFANSLLFLKDFLVGMLVYFLDVRNKHVYSDISAKFLDDFLESCIFAILKKFTLLWKSIHIAKIWEVNYFEWHHLCYSCFITLSSGNDLLLPTISNQKMLDKMSFSMILITLGGATLHLQDSSISVMSFVR